MRRFVGVWMILFSISIAGTVKGCDWYEKTNQTMPSGIQKHRASLRLVPGSDLQAKAAGLRIEALALDEFGAPTGEVVGPLEIANPVLPLDIPLTLYVPPCQWRILLTVNLMRDGPRTANAVLDACNQTMLPMTVDTFEPMIIPAGSAPIHAPQSAIAGAAIPVSCGPVPNLNAPDSDRAPVSAILSESEGINRDGPIGPASAVSGNFPDPYLLTSPRTTRTFTCRIYDGRSQSQTFSAAVQRILPTPTSTINPTPNPTPTISHTPTPTTPPPSPTPDPCEECSLANATTACINGVCEIAVCHSGYGNCDALTVNGCETDLTTLINCGACGLACSLANAIASCSAGVCEIAACHSGYGNCDMLAANGCEIDVTTNVFHCGVCNAACSSANGTASCTMGFCDIVCQPGYANCDHDARTNGCEIDVTTDINNCGGCTLACSIGQVCIGGICTTP